MVEHRRCSVILLLKIIIVFQSASAQFDHKYEAIAVANNTSNSLRNARENILLYYREKMSGESRRHRVKRYDATVFRGHPKTREERWHANFKTNGSNSEMEQTQSLVILLNKIVDKYLSACIPIILYDKYVETSDSVILQTFFQVTPASNIAYICLSNDNIFPRRASKYRICMVKSMQIIQWSIGICCFPTIKSAGAIFFSCRMRDVRETFWGHKRIIASF